MICKKNKNSALVALVLTLALAFQLIMPLRSNASDHIDGPQLAHDHASDINDMYFFLDPNDNTRVVMVMTINPFLISSEIIGQAIFDHNLRYRFEIENTGDAQPDKFIDVRFTRGVGRETAQTALVTLPEGQRFFVPLKPSTPRVEIPSVDTSRFDINALVNGQNFMGQTNVPSQGDDTNDIEPPDLPVTTDPATGVSFFAGITEDPFFLDNTAANRFVLSSIRNPGNPNRNVFRNRAGFNAPDGSSPDADNQGAAPLQARNQGVNQGAGRDTYSGFNTLTIAISVPATMLRSRGLANNELGLNGVTQRQRIQMVREDGQVSGSGDWVTVDREGNPLVVNGLIPAPRKDEYNGASTVDDAAGRFRPDLIMALRNFATNDEFIGRILNVIQVRGDILRLNLQVRNTGSGGGNNPDGGPANMGGRRLRDDVADATFTLINNGQPLGDFVDGNEFLFGDRFPFVAPQIMPNPNGVNNVDTRLRL